MIILKVLVYRSISLDILLRPIITHNNGYWYGFGISLGEIVMAQAKGYRGFVASQQLSNPLGHTVTKLITIILCIRTTDNY